MDEHLRLVINTPEGQVELYGEDFEYEGSYRGADGKDVKVYHHDPIQTCARCGTTGRIIAERWERSEAANYIFYCPDCSEINKRLRED